MQKQAGQQELHDFTIPLTREQAKAILAMEEEEAIFILMDLSKKLAAFQKKQTVQGSTPSGMVPPYEKPPKRGRKKKPGAKKGHQGKRRPSPEPTREEEHSPLKTCPECGTQVSEPSERRFRLIEDIVVPEVEVVKHSIPRQWCPCCQKLVEPPVADALPGATFGHRLMALTCWLHYGIGVTMSMVLAMVSYHLQFELSVGGLVDAWHRMAEVFYQWYEQIGEDVKESGVLHADETGWRESGKTRWLWCFTTKQATYYMIHQSRGSPALSTFFTETFNGTLVTDFWGAYGKVTSASRQACLPHLFRELAKVDETSASPAWAAFSRKLGRLLRDALRLQARRNEFDEKTFIRRRSRITKRLDGMVRKQSRNDDVARIQKRLIRYHDAMFTFLDHPDVPADNNHAEREIRPAVIMRKNSYCNRSERGANTQAIMMSIYRTLKLRGLHPLRTIENALRTYVLTGSLPPLPAESISDS